MRYPYDRFLTFLVSRKVEPNPALLKYGLPYIDRLWILDCRKRIRETAPHSVIAHLDSDDRRVLATDGFLEWAGREGIRPLWEVQHEFGGGGLPDALDTAFSLFINRHSRSVLGLLLLARLEEATALELANEQLQVGLDAPALALYRSLFWDVDRVPRKSWPIFAESLLTKEEQHLITIGYRDQPGPDVIRAVLGLEPAKVTEAEALKHLIETAHERFKTALAQPDVETGDGFKWAQILLKAVTASTVKQKLGGGEEPGQSVDLSGLFSVKVTKSHHVSLSELQGHFSAPEGPKLSES